MIKMCVELRHFEPKTFQKTKNEKRIKKILGENDFRHSFQSEFVHIASKWNLWASCNFSILSSLRSFQYRTPIITVISPQVAVSAAALRTINLLGVTKSCTFHLEGSSIGFGMTTICEFGMICGHFWDLLAIWKKNVLLIFWPIYAQFKLSINPIKTRQYTYCHVELKFHLLPYVYIQYYMYKMFLISKNATYYTLRWLLSLPIVIVRKYFSFIIIIIFSR